MASNNYLNANVTPSSDTFREWIDLTNRITYDMEKVVVSTVANTQGACTSGNAYVNGSFSANSLLVEDKLQGVSANSTVYGTKAAAANLVISSNVVFIANSTANAIIHAQSNAHFGAGIQLTTNSTSNNVTVNSQAKVFESNAVTNIFNTKIDANANVDIDNTLTDITSTNLAITGTETNIDANTVFTANVNITADAADFNIGADEVIINSSATSFTTNATTNIFNTPLDINANMDIDAGLVDIAAGNVVSSSNVSITGVNTSITSTKIVLGDATTDDLTVGADSVFNGNVQVTGALVDVDQDLNVDGDVTLNANLVVGSNNSDGANIQSLIVSSIEPSANGKVLGHADRRWAAALTTANTSGDITAGADVDITGEVNAASAAIVGAATVGTTLGVTGVGTFGNDVDITGEVNAATAAIVGAATVGGNLTLSGDLDAANNKEANVYNAVVRNDLTVTADSVLNGNVTANSAKDFVIGNSSYTALQSNVSSNVKTIAVGSVADSNNRLTIKSVVGTSTFGLMPLHGNNIAFGNNTNRWHNASFTNANTSGTLTSTGVITASANIEAAATTNTNVLKVTTTSTMGGKLTISSDGAAITGPVDLVNSINVGANVGMTTAHMLVKGTATVGNTIANSSVLHVGNSTVNTHISKGGIDTDGTIAVLKAATFSNTITATGFINSAASLETAGNIKAASANVSGHTNVATLGATGAVDLDSTLTVEGLTNLKGSVDLGDAATDTVSFVADVDTNILPSANGKALGADTARWAAAFTDANTSGDLTVGDDINLANTSNVIFSNTGISANATTLSSNNLTVDHLQVGVSATLPDDTALTASTLSAANGTITNNFQITGATAGAANSVFTIGNGSNTVHIEFANAAANGHLLAKTTNTSDIGSAAKSFRSGYFDTSIVVGDTVANTTALLADFVYAKQDLVANYSSDQQLKDNVLKIDTALDKVNSLGGYSFTWNNNIGDMRAGTPDYGVIAQEIEDVLPHAVDINSRGHKTVNYNSLIPLLIEAVKELTERVKELEPDVEEPEIEEDVDG